jgi:MFS family permease
MATSSMQASLITDTAVSTNGQDPKPLPEVKTSAAMPTDRALGGTERQARQIGFRMTVIAFLAQNAMSGLVIGSFGQLVTTFEARFHVARSVSTLGVPLVLLPLGLLAPLIGVLLRRVSIRTMMLAGAVLSLSGFALLALANTMATILWAYGLLLGPGYALLGSVLPSALVSNWFVYGRGRALGIVNMPLMLSVVPPVSSWLLMNFGLRATYASMAVAMLCLLPALFFVVDKPEQLGLRPVGMVEPASSAPVQTITYGRLIREPAYWAVAISGCILSGGAIIIVTHIAPMAVGWGISPARASLLVAAVGGVGMLGSPLFGRLADRLGGTSALALNAGAQAILFALLIAHPSFMLLLAVAAGLGLTIGGTNASVGTALSEDFGPENFGHTYGLYVFVNLPFMVGLAPLAGYLFVVTGSYAVPLGGQVAALCVVAAIGVVSRKNKSRSRVRTATIT